MPSLIFKDELWTLVAFDLAAFHSVTVYFFVWHHGWCIVLSKICPPSLSGCALRLNLLFFLCYMSHQRCIYSCYENSHCNQVQINGKIISVNLKSSRSTAFSILINSETGLQFCHHQLCYFLSPFLSHVAGDDSGLWSLPRQLLVVAASCTSVPAHDVSRLTNSSWVICPLKHMFLF